MITRESTCFIFSSWLPLKKIFFSAVFAVLECFFFLEIVQLPFPLPQKNMVRSSKKPKARRCLCIWFIRPEVVMLLS